MKKKEETIVHDLDRCPIRTVLDRFGDKWSILVMINLSTNGKMRFNEINKSMSDVSQKMLTVTLRSLEADGLVSRKIYPEIPPRVEYDLTPLGKSLLPHIESLRDWANENLSAIKKSRKKFAVV
ncbi:MAG: helix-turn-helix domain-containing protein [Bacteroidota bacterium]